MSTLLTRPSTNHLLCLTLSQWSELQDAVKSHFEKGTVLPKNCDFVISLTREQWHTTKTELGSRIQANQPAVKEQLKEVHRDSRREYMREYMRKRRQNDKE